MRQISLHEGQHLEGFIGGILGALTWDGHGPTQLQLDLIAAVLHRIHLPAGTEPPPMVALEPERVAELLPTETLRHQLAQYVVGLELVLHPLPRGLERHVEHYLARVGTQTPFVRILRDTASGSALSLHADLLRNSWYTEQTIKGMFHGRLHELVHSKLAYYGLDRDAELASKWRALSRCPEGSWGRGVADFYEVHGFAVPGEHHGIYEVGALHDWIHVLADYGTDAEGEIDVFAFIAATMNDPRGFVQFLFTLALFQNATVNTVGGLKVRIARADTLADEGAPDRLADAFVRAGTCTEDVMGGVDHFALANMQLDELRDRWAIRPKEVPSPGAFDTPLRAETPA